MVSYLPLFAVQNPWAFFALLALAVPVVLHLLSNSPAKLIKFANIALITARAPKNIRQIRLSEFWLLILRLLLLIVSILLLANIIVAKPLINQAEVYLLSADWLNQSDINERQQLLNSSVNKPVYLLARHTELISAEQILNWPQQRTVITHSQPAQQDNILLHLEIFSQLLTPETNIKLLLTDRASQYQVHAANKPLTLANPIDWQIKHLDVNPSKQYPNVMQVVIIYDQDRLSELTYFQQALSLIKQHLAPKLVIDSFINHDLKNSDLYQQVMQTQPDWLFYLSAQTLDNAMVNAITSGANVFVDAEQVAVNLMTTATVSINKNSSELLPADATFYRRALPVDIAEQVSHFGISKAAETLWQFSEPSGETLPMLTKSSFSYRPEALENSVAENPPVFNTGQGSRDKAKRAGALYQLYSRFSPSWSNLLVTKQAPILLQNLLFSSWQKQQMADQQTLTEGQIRQLINRAKPVSVATATADNSLELRHATQLILQQQSSTDFYTELLMVLLLILAIIERMVSEFFRSNKPVSSQSKAAVVKAAKVDD